MDPNLIFDVGMHLGQDTTYYLKKGYRVVGIEADPLLVDGARAHFADAVAEGRLRLVWCALGQDQDPAVFYRSANTLWSSVNRKIATREQLHAEIMRVPTKRLADLFDEHGVPVYCKIDIEGMDAACLRTLKNVSELPKWLSVESECVADESDGPENDPLETLAELAHLGFTRFQLVDQMSLVVLTPSVSVYRDRPRWWERVASRMSVHHYQYYNYHHAVEENRKRLAEIHQFAFPQDSSGPLGAELDGPWLDVATAVRALIKHRIEYFRMPGATPHGFWCDWHATTDGASIDKRDKRRSWVAWAQGRVQKVLHAWSPTAGAP